MGGRRRIARNLGRWLDLLRPGWRSRRRWCLSQRRANSVADYLLSQGVAPNKVASEGKGESEPVADNDTEEGRAKNRRVDLHINVT